MEYSYQPPAETERRSTGSTGTIDILNDTPSCSNVGGFVVYSGFYSLDISMWFTPKKLQTDLETATFNYTDTPLTIPILIPFKQVDRVGDTPLSIPTHSQIQQRSSTRA